MLTLLAFLAAGAGEASAPVTVDAPVSHVTVYQNGALVERRGSVRIPQGRSTIRFANLPGGLRRNSLRLEAQGATVLRVEALQLQQPRITVEAAEAKLQTLEGLNRQRQELQNLAQNLSLEETLLQRLQPAGGKAEEERQVNFASPELVSRVASFVETRYLAARKQREELQTKIRETDDEIAAVRSELSLLTSGAWSTSIYEIRADVESASSRTVNFGLRYTIQGTQWQPSYELHYDAQRRRTRLRMIGAVNQTTGEDWTNARLSLATTHVVERAELPELLTWTLGEERDFVPQARAAYSPNRPTALPLPPRLPPAWQQQTLERLQELRNRLVGTNRAGLARRSTDGLMGAGSSGAPTREAMDSAQSAPRARKLKSKKRERMPPPSNRGAPAAAPMEAEEDSFFMGDSAEISGSLVAADGAQVAPEGAQIGLLLERPPLQRPAPLGGFAHVFSAPGTFTLASGPERQNVPLASFEMETKPFYETTPALEERVFMTAEVKNTGKIPLLSGPVSVFSGKTFVVDANLPSTGPSGTVKMPLGVVHDIEIKRRSKSTKITQGLISEDDITRYEVVIEAINRKRHAVRLRVHDQVPRSKQKEVEVSLEGLNPAPATGPGDDGLLSWDVELVPGQKREIKLIYEVKRPKNWEVYQ